MKYATLHVLSLCLLLVFLSPGYSAAESGSAFPRKQITLHGNGTAGPYTVGVRFIESTVSIDTTFANSALTVSSLDGNEGSLTLSRALAAGDSVKILFTPVPEWLSKTYSRPVSQRSSAMPGLNTSYEGIREKTPKPFPGLTFGGSKSFDVNVGAGQETALNQSLRLNISGKLTEDITLNAAVSDQNVPISTEGDTRELEELDRILIELRGKHFSADMGDNDLHHEGGRWDTWSRRLSGAKVTVNGGGVSVFGSGAVSDGRYMSTTIAPVDGNQGPYRLIARNGNRDISIIPGTEKIWINGIQLTRGNNYDYTIDYTTGEVIFTSARIIGADMRIVADYEYTSESFRRTFYSGGADGSFLNGRVKLAVSAAREADDTSRPVLGTLDEASRRALAQAGDSLAVTSGIRSATGDSTGTYDLSGEILVYNPKGKGKYNVTFSWVGQDKGHYRYLGGGIYEYVPAEKAGSGSGASYDPVATVSAPVAHQLAGMRLSVTPFSGVSFESEIAGSSYDANTLSGLNDTDNEGGAYRFELKAAPTVTIGLPVRLEFTGSRRSQGKTFNPLDRDRSAEENRRWGLPLIAQSGEETVSEYAGGFTLSEGRFGGTGISVQSGKALYGGSALSNRDGVYGTFSLGDFKSRLTVTNISRKAVTGLPDEKIRRILGGMETRFAGFTPSLSYEGELAEGTGVSTHGEAYNDLRTQLQTPELSGIRGGLEWFYRTDRAKKNPAWSDSALARGGSVELTAGKGIQGTMKTTYSRREYTLSGSSRTATDQAMVEGYYRPEKGFMRFDGSYQAGRLCETTKRKNYIYTGAGKGSYRWEDSNNDGVRDPDEFIPDEYGSYYLYEETLDDYRPVNMVHAYGKLGLDIPGALLFRLCGQNKINSETSFEINEKSSAPAGELFLLKLGSFRKRGKTLSGDSRIQEDITLPVSGGQGSIRIRLFRRDSYNAEFVTGGERNGEEEQSVRFRIPIVSGTSDGELTLTRAGWTRFMEGYQSGNYSVRSLYGEAGASLYPQTAVTLSLTGGAGYDRDAVTALRAQYYLLKPGFTYRFSGRGKVETSYSFTSVGLSGANSGTRLPYTMARGRKEGDNHDLQVMYDYRLTQRMNTIATYTGRKFAGSKFENFASVQLRALF
ncbi:MAG: hypothetical protein WCU00_04950 [Candidatus Latescibacterota bacterium]